MRYIGTQAKGIRLPIINKGAPLAKIVADYVTVTADVGGFSICENDVVGIKEAVVAKAQGNYATMDQLSADVRQKYPGGKVGVVFPILSRNRFFNILKGIIQGADEVFILLSYPSDEVGNPIMDIEQIDEITDRLKTLPPGPIPAKEFREIAGDFTHPFTNMDYISLYESLGAKVYLSADPRDILQLTSHVLAADIHTRFLTKSRLQKAGAKTIYTLSDILSKPVGGSGFNPEYGVLGSNISTDDRLKLFPRECDAFIEDVQNEFEARVGVRPQVMVYGDGAFKDPMCGIWELADPVVSPAYTSGLEGQPNEIKFKMIADTRLADLEGEDQEEAIKEIIRQKAEAANDGKPSYDQEGTTPRRYTDLLGSLCDLISGSGDKGTPVVLVQGYFDSYAD
ncbi:MAG: coenzyme F420-0:L-glutamate ligase [Defluviitaleaceae bacterium]|nr:coenzyme F420-0:L-glutamate ligase [Defluviitaleaceae bacterium]